MKKILPESIRHLQQSQIPLYESGMMVSEFETFRNKNSHDIEQANRQLFFTAKMMDSFGNSFATLPQIMSAVIDATNKGDSVNINFTANTEEFYGHSTSNGNAYYAVLHGCDLLNALDVVQRKSSLVQEEYMNCLLKGRLPDNTPVQLYDIVDVCQGKVSDPLGRYGVILHEQDLPSNNSLAVRKEDVRTNSLLLARAGSKELAETYIEAVQNEYGLPCCQYTLPDNKASTQVRLSSLTENGFSTRNFTSEPHQYLLQKRGSQQ
jgi:hypothetical protein